MPHSSGGGSHGGGFHGGGSHGGSSGNRVSTHYFAGARRYRKHHRRTGLDEYVYATSKPSKTGLSAVIIVGIICSVFMSAFFASKENTLPQRLREQYLDVPSVYDDIEVIRDDDALISTLKEYNAITGICPVIYTVYDEDWNGMYADLEAFTFDTYVNNFSDEQHFVIVYSIPENQAGAFKDGRLEVPDYSWEAVQGDETDQLITEGMFRRFGNQVQSSLEAGADPGEAFNDAFILAKSSAEGQLKKGTPQRIMKVVSSLIPIIIVGGFFALFMFFTIRQYVRDRDVEYEEVPFDGSEPVSSGKAGLSAGAYAQTVNGNSVNNNESRRAAAKIGAIFGMVFISPFVFSGLIMTGSGIFLLTNVDADMGRFMLLFGLVWTLFSSAMLVSLIVLLVKSRSKAKTVPLTAEYPKAEYPGYNYPDPDEGGTNSTGTRTSSSAEQEFDPQFFQTSKSNYEDDDEDYKRMKRQGFE